MYWWRKNVSDTFLFFWLSYLWNNYHNLQCGKTDWFIVGSRRFLMAVMGNVSASEEVWARKAWVNYFKLLTSLDANSWTWEQEMVECWSQCLLQEHPQQLATNFQETMPKSSFTTGYFQRYLDNLKSHDLQYWSEKTLTRYIAWVEFFLWKLLRRASATIFIDSSLDFLFFWADAGTPEWFWSSFFFLEWDAIFYPSSYSLLGCFLFIRGNCCRVSRSQMDCARSWFASLPQIFDGLVVSR